MKQIEILQNTLLSILFLVPFFLFLFHFYFPLFPLFLGTASSRKPSLQARNLQHVPKFISLSLYSLQISAPFSSDPEGRDEPTCSFHACFLPSPVVCHIIPEILFQLKMELIFGQVSHPTNQESIINYCASSLIS